MYVDCDVSGTQGCAMLGAVAVVSNMSGAVTKREFIVGC